LSDVVERDEVEVMLVRVADEVPAIRDGCAKLEAIVGLRGRHFFGVFDGAANEYRVCVEVRDGDDAALLGLERGVIPGGRYRRERLRGDAPAVYDRIGPTVGALEAEGGVDESRPVVEHYRRHDEIDVLVPVA
jgi:hypothetical protein